MAKKKFNFSGLQEQIKTEIVQSSEKPTAKQINFAKDISRKLDIPLPIIKTKAAYTEYISKHAKKLKSDRSVGYCDDNPLGVSELHGIDCYDLGISPYGSGFFED